MKSHSTTELTRYPLRFQVRILFSIARGVRKGSEETGLPDLVQPKSTVAGTCRLRLIGALSRLLRGVIVRGLGKIGATVSTGLAVSNKVRSACA